MSTRFAHPRFQPFGSLALTNKGKGKGKSKVERMEEAARRAAEREAREEARKKKQKNCSDIKHDRTKLVHEKNRVKDRLQGKLTKRTGFLGLGDREPLSSDKVDWNKVRELHEEFNTLRAQIKLKDAKLKLMGCKGK